jgi:hypothetical protein
MAERTLEELIDLREPGWPIVEDWIAHATNPVEVLPVDPARAAEVLTRLQITTRSPTGAIAYHSGGIVIDGWLRIFGGGGPRMRGDLARWNGLGDEPCFAPPRGSFVVAVDVLGGLFAAMASTRTVSYFAPDELAWEDLELGYSDFVNTMMQTDLEAFCEGLRWDGWRDAAAAITLDQGFSVMPPLWSKEAKTRPLDRRAVPMSELVGLAFEMATQLSAGS